MDPVDLPPPAAPSGPVHAIPSLWLRFFAEVVDAIIVGTAVAIVFAATASLAAAQVSGAAVAFLYSWALVARDGQTVGKKIMRTRVVMYDTGAVPDSGAAAIRSALKNLVSALPLVGILYTIVLVVMIIISPERRGPHDLGAKTIVTFA